MQDVSVSGLFRFGSHYVGHDDDKRPQPLWGTHVGSGGTIEIGCGLPFLTNVVILSPNFTTKVAFVTGMV